MLDPAVLDAMHAKLSFDMAWSLQKVFVLSIGFPNGEHGYTFKLYKELSLHFQH